MRSKRKRSPQMRLGQTIVAERERVESESERMLARKKAHRRQTTSVLIVALMLLILGLAFYLGMKELAITPELESEDTGYQIRATIVDEDRRGQVSGRVRTFIATLEQDLQELGLRMTKVTLPTGASRELYVDLDGQTTYYKVDISRNAATTAEDIERMTRYLRENDLHPTYVDVRVEGKAYYK